VLDGVGDTGGSPDHGALGTGDGTADAPLGLLGSGDGTDGKGVRKRISKIGRVVIDHASKMKKTIDAEDSTSGVSRVADRCVAARPWPDSVRRLRAACRWTLARGAGDAHLCRAQVHAKSGRRSWRSQALHVHVVAVWSGRAAALHDLPVGLGTFHCAVFWRLAAVAVTAGRTVLTTLQNWMSSDSQYSAFSFSILWSAALVAASFVVCPDHVSSIVASKIDEKTSKLVRLEHLPRCAVSLR
jgi:hypothetical protein